MGPNAMRRSSVTLPYGRGSVTELRARVRKGQRYFRNITLALASTGLWAQTLSIPPSLVTRGSSSSLLLILDSPPGKAPAALQWQFTFPPNVSVAGGYHRGQRSGIGPKGSHVPDGRRCESSQEKRRVRLSFLPEGRSRFPMVRLRLFATKCRGKSGKFRRRSGLGRSSGQRRTCIISNRRRTSRHCRKVSDFRFWPVACFNWPSMTEIRAISIYAVVALGSGLLAVGCNRSPQDQRSAIPETGKGTEAAKKDYGRATPGISQCHQE